MLTGTETDGSPSVPANLETVQSLRPQAKEGSGCCVAPCMSRLIRVLGPHFLELERTIVSLAPESTISFHVTLGFSRGWGDV